MKTQYFRKHKRSLTPLQGAGIVLAGGMLFIFFLLRFFAPGFLVALAQPFWYAGDFLTSKMQLNETAETLTKQVAALTEENEALTNENRLLAERVKEDLPDARGISAGVLVRPPVSPYDVLIVGKGSDDGVYVDMRVFSKHIPVGTVESVAGKSARVLLFSASGRESEGWIGEKHIPVTVRGEGGGAFIADVPREASITEGDAVYLPGPGALPIGVVAHIESHPSSPRAILQIRPYTNPFGIVLVHIVTSPSPR